MDLSPLLPRQKAASRVRREEAPRAARGGTEGAATSERKAARDDTYHNCVRTGHWARECCQRRSGQAHVVRAEEEDEPAMFLAHGSIELFPTASATTALFHLDKPRAHIFIDDGTSDDKIDLWFLDSGATHHMTGVGSSSLT